MTSQTALRAAVFLDRDGTINEEIGYLDNPEKLRILPGAARAIRMINRCGMAAIVVTNQSGIARGYFDEPTLEAIHRRLGDDIARKGARIDRFYYCPHHPTQGETPYRRDCPCRKPAPGMLFKAARELSLSLADSWIVGDTLKDIEAGARAGVRGVLVKTGYGNEALEELKKNDTEGMDIFRPAWIAETLEEAIRWIVDHPDRQSR